MTRICDQGGLLVGSLFPIPSNPWEYAYPGRTDTVGCSHLQCSACGSAVRHLDDQLIWVTGTVVEHDRILASAYEAGEFPGHVLRSQERARTYYCRCKEYATSRVEALLPHDRFEGPSHSGPNVPWGCAGHEAPSLPTQIDGVDLAEGMDLPALVADAIARRVPVPPVEAASSEWLAGLRATFEGTPFAAALDAAILAGLHGADPVTRATALVWAFRHKTPEAIEALFAAAQGDRAGFIDVPDPNPAWGPTLETRLVGTLADLAVAGAFPYARVLPILHDGASKPALAQAVVESLVRLDPTWLTENVSTLVQADPSPALLDRLLRYVRAAVWVPAAQAHVAPDTLRAWAESNAYGAARALLLPSATST